MTVMERERRALDRIKSRCEAEGSTFIEKPAASELPAFLQGYQPDALVLGKNKKIVIEVKARRSPATKGYLRQLSERFAGQPDWEFQIVYGGEGEEDEEPILAATAEQIAAQIDEAEALLARNHGRAALMLGWAAIEASARTLEPDLPAEGSRSLRQAVELLEHLGRLGSEDARTLRELLPLRNRIAHGDLSTTVAVDQVAPVLRAARAVLAAA